VRTGRFAKRHLGVGQFFGVQFRPAAFHNRAPVRCERCWSHSPTTPGHTSARRDSRSPH
jgi:hypothetical protein